MAKPVEDEKGKNRTPVIAACIAAAGTIIAAYFAHSASVTAAELAVKANKYTACVQYVAQMQEILVKADPDETHASADLVRQWAVDVFKDCSPVPVSENLELLLRAGKRQLPKLIVGEAHMIG
jgi:hypothetical protein